MNSKEKDEYVNQTMERMTSMEPYYCNPFDNPKELKERASDLLKQLNSLGDNAQEEKESIIQASKSLIALEIMGGNMLSEPDYDSKLQKYYQAECERQIKEIMKSFGWQEVYVKFNYK